MSYIASNPSLFQGQVVGNGQCVAFVRAAAIAPPSGQWSEGAKVKGAAILPGTAIATFVNGQYPNNSTGNHAAIYVSQDANAMTVWDQWKGQPVHQRSIRFRGGQGSASNDGDAYSVIE